MGFDLDVDNGAKLSTGEGLKPEWFTLKKGQTVRAYFLSKPTVEFTYRLTEQRKDKMTGNRQKDFRGVYISLSCSNPEDFNDIEGLVQSGDPDGQLSIDARYLGMPDYSATIPMLLYPEKNPKTGKISVNNIRVVFVKFTKAKLNNFLKEIEILKEQKNKSFNEVDFFVTQEDKEIGTWHFRHADDSIYVANKKALEPRVTALLDEELAFLNLKDVKELSKFLGFRMTEEQWKQKLNQLGYILNNNVGVETTEDVVEENVVVDGDFESPELNDEIPAL